jgi:hypothetical protein
MKRFVLIAMVLGCGLAVPAGATARRAQDCTFPGPKWSVGGTTGTTYDLTTSSVTCAYATPWARKLAGAPNKKPYYPVSGGPPGWSCNAQAPGARITVGACVKGTKRFAWHAATY